MSDDGDSALARRRALRERRNKEQEESKSPPDEKDEEEGDVGSSMRERIKQRRKLFEKEEAKELERAEKIQPLPDSPSKRVSRFRRIAEEKELVTEPKVVEPVVKEEPTSPAKEKPKDEHKSPEKVAEPALKEEKQSEVQSSPVKEDTSKEEQKTPKKIDTEAPQTPPKHETSYNDAENAGHRLYAKGKDFVKIHEQKIESQRKAKADAELTEATFKPSISKKSQGIAKKDNHYDYNKEWKSRVDEDVQKKREAKLKIEEDEQKVTKLEMNSKSKAIVERKKKDKSYTGPISGWEKRFDDYQMHHRLAQAELPFSPQIDSHSKKIVESKPTGENTFERLYNLSASKKNKEGVDEEKKSPQKKSETEIKNFIKYLQSKGDEIEKKKIDYKNQIESETNTKPKLNRTSMRIAKYQYRQPLYKTPPKRPQSASSLDKSSSKRNYDQSPSSPRTMEIIRNRAAQEKVKRERIEFIRKLQDERELKECTFKPNLNPKSMSMAVNFLADENDDYDDFDEFEDSYEYDEESFRTRSSPSSPRHSQLHLSNFRQSSSPLLKRQSSSNGQISPLNKKALSQSNMMQKQQKQQFQSPQVHNYQQPPKPSPFNLREPEIDHAEDERGLEDDTYLSSLEQEMKSALDDWTRLEQMQL
jgi:hypothetical protein